MREIWLIADTHFGDPHIMDFARSDGLRMRDFPDVAAMNAHIIDRWNSVVKPSDLVYHLGDVAADAKSLELIAKCNGRKKLIAGNDQLGTLEYLKYFEEIYGSRHLEGMVLSHIPVHVIALDEKLHGNVHGHLHGHFSSDFLGPKYLTVSVEMVNYTPVNVDEVRFIFRKRKQSA